MNADDRALIKADVEEVVTRVVNNSQNEILTAVGDQLSIVIGRVDSVDERLSKKIDSVDERLSKKIDSVDERLSGQIYRLERKVDNVIDDHEIRISNLEKATK